jgi:hypothetical protein
MDPALANRGLALVCWGLFFIDQSGIDAAERACALVFLACMILVAAIWQAVGLGVARVHMVLSGIDLERRAGRRSRE